MILKKKLKITKFAIFFSFQHLEIFDKFFENFEIRAAQNCENLADLEKCWKMTIYLQRSAPIQPRTSLGKRDVSCTIMKTVGGRTTPPKCSSHQSVWMIARRPRFVTACRTENRHKAIHGLDSAEDLLATRMTTLCKLLTSQCSRSHRDLTGNMTCAFFEWKKKLRAPRCR